MNLAGFATAIRGVADRAEAGLALDACTEASKDFLAVLRAVTPKRSGHLADSETVDAVTGNGERATGIVAPHAVYAEFRNRGGTIHVRNAKVLTDGVSFFGRSVTQAGARYMEKGQAAGGPVVEAACRLVAEQYIRL